MLLYSFFEADKKMAQYSLQLGSGDIHCLMMPKEKRRK